MKRRTRLRRLGHDPALVPRGADHPDPLVAELARELAGTPMRNSLALDARVQADARTHGARKTVQCLALTGLTVTEFRARVL